MRSTLRAGASVQALDHSPELPGNRSRGRDQLASTDPALDPLLPDARFRKGIQFFSDSALAPEGRYMLHPNRSSTATTRSGALADSPFIHKLHAHTDMRFGKVCAIKADDVLAVTFVQDLQLA